MTTLVSRDFEEWAIGQWLLGYHLEDLDMFEPYHFTQYGRIVRMLKDGVRDIAELYEKSGLDAAEFNYLLHCNADQLYEVGVLNLQKKLCEEWLFENPDASPEEIAENMKRFSKKSAELPSVTRDPIGEFIEELDRRKNEKPVPTGLSDLDRLLCGVRKKELTAVGARPSVGKSAFIQQIAMTVARSGHKVLFFPLEMSEMAIIQRLVMRYTDIPQNEIRNGLERATWERSADGIDVAYEFMQRGNFMIFERCNDLQTIRRLIELHKPYMIVIDQLEQLKDGQERFQDKRSRFSHMTHEMQAISLDMDVAVWFACQINRDADNSPPTMANLKESGTIEEDSTNVILLHRDGDKTAMQNIRMELAKQKDGECGVIDLMFDAPHFTFRGIERGYS